MKLPRRIILPFQPYNIGEKGTCKGFQDAENSVKWHTYSQNAVAKRKVVSVFKTTSNSVYCFKYPNNRCLSVKGGMRGCTHLVQYFNFSANHVCCLFVSLCLFDLFALLFVSV